MSNTQLPITCVIVVYNQGKLLENAIKSVREKVGDIVVIHDGPCTDDSVDISKKYKCRVYIRKHRGHSELNRSFSYRKAKYKWVIQLDADEYVSLSSASIEKMIKSRTIGTYGFRWEFQIRGKSVFMGYKTTIFNLDRVSFIGSIHQIATARDNYHHKNTNQILFHRSNYQHSSIRDMKKKLSKWALIHASEYQRPVQSFDNWNYSSDSWPTATQYRINYPTVFGYILTPFFVIIQAFINVLISRSLTPLGYGLNYVIYWIMVTKNYKKLKFNQ